MLLTGNARPHNCAKIGSVSWIYRQDVPDIVRPTLASQPYGITPDNTVRLESSLKKYSQTHIAILLISKSYGCLACLLIGAAYKTICHSSKQTANDRRYPEKPKLLNGPATGKDCNSRTTSRINRGVCYRYADQMYKRQA